MDRVFLTGNNSLIAHTRFLIGMYITWVASLLVEIMGYRSVILPRKLTKSLCTRECRTFAYDNVRAIDLLNITEIELKKIFIKEQQMFNPSQPSVRIFEASLLFPPSFQQTRRLMESKVCCYDLAIMKWVVTCKCLLWFRPFEIKSSASFIVQLLVPQSTSFYSWDRSLVSRIKDNLTSHRARDMAFTIASW